MSITVEKFGDDTKVTKVKYVHSDGKHRVKCSFKNVTGLFVLGYRYDRELEPIKYVMECISGMDEKGLCVNHKDTENILLHVSRSHYPSIGVELPIKKSFEYPMKIIVLCYRIVNEKLVLYEQDDQDNTAKIQYKIKYTKKFKRGFWIFTPSKTIVKIPKFDGFFEGLMYYTIDGSHARYPISEKMMGKEFEIRVKHAGEFSLKINDGYKEFYKCETE